MIIIYIYAIFNIILGIISLKTIPLRNIALIELSGACILLSAFLNNILLLLVGLLINQIAMILNGLHMYGKLNIKHHIVRLFVNIAMFFIFYFSR